MKKSVVAVALMLALAALGGANWAGLGDAAVGAPVSDAEAAQLNGGACSYHYWAACYYPFLGCAEVYCYYPSIFGSYYLDTFYVPNGCGGSCGGYYGINSTCLTGTIVAGGT
jgi:hypothetical protein